MKLQKLGDERKIAFAVVGLILSIIGLVVIAIKKFKDKE